MFLNKTQLTISIAILTLIAIVSTDRKVVPIAILLALIYALSYDVVLKKLQEKFVNHFGPSPVNCSIYKNSIVNTGTQFYPLHNDDNDLRPGEADNF